MPLIIDHKSKSAEKRRGCWILVCWIGAAVVCLLLLLLSLILMAHNYKAISQMDNKYENLFYNLTKDKKATLKNQPDFKKVNFSGLVQDQNTLRHEREALKQERNELMNYTGSLTKDRDDLKIELVALRKEQNQLKTHLGDLTSEINTLRGEREVLKAERTALRNEQNQFMVQFNNLTRYKDSLKKERDALRDERGTLTVERGVLKDERDRLKMLTFNLTKDKDALRDERDAFRNEQDKLKIQVNGTTRNIETLKSQYGAVVASQDHLQEEADRIKLKQKAKTCQQGWTLFNNKCYYFSSGGLNKNWEDSRQDCLVRGGHLAMPKTRAERVYVSRTATYVWIGLSDVERENVWLWVDGTELTGDEPWRSGEPNNIGEEDCVGLVRKDAKFNDFSCQGKYSWVCEH